MCFSIDSSEVLHSEIRQKDSARGSEVENAHEDSECLFGKSSLCRKYFSDAFSCRRALALARDLFKEVSGFLSWHRLAGVFGDIASSATSDCSSPLPVDSLSPGVSSPSSVWLKRLWRPRIKFDLAMELVFLRRLRRQVWPSTLWAIKVRWNQQEKEHGTGRC